MVTADNKSPIVCVWGGTFCARYITTLGDRQLTGIQRCKQSVCSNFQLTGRQLAASFMRNVNLLFYERSHSWCMAPPLSDHSLYMRSPLDVDGQPVGLLGP